MALGLCLISRFSVAVVFAGAGVGQASETLFVDDVFLFSVLRSLSLFTQSNAGHRPCAWALQTLKELCAANGGGRKGAQPLPA